VDLMNLLQFKLRLVASDNLNENFTTVLIHIKDVNDNPPTFDRPTYETQITEEDDRHVPKRILQVIAIANFVDISPPFSAYLTPN
jgi:hypothetical protein